MADLLANSAKFRQLWAENEIHVYRGVHKRMWHPELGTLDLDYEILTIPHRDQRLVLYTSAPGTASYDALALLRVTGSERLRADNEGAGAFPIR